MSEVILWKETLERKVHIIHSQIASIQKWIQDTNNDQTIFESMSAPYYDLLNKIYEEEFPIANAIENSDLVLRFEGPSINVSNPKLSLVTGIFSSVRKQVTSLTKAFAGLTDIQGALSKELDLGLSAVAKGSLILGFTIPSSDINLLGEDDPLLKATKDAIKTLGIVSKYITDELNLTEIEVEVSDPKIRDIALVAVKNISPSGRSGINRVGIASKAFEQGKPSILTPETRKSMRKILIHPVKSFENYTLTGIVREIDLDAKRFELRRISHEEIEDIRCIYSTESEKQIPKILDKKIKVKGKVARDSKGKPRLMEINNLEIIN